jgi:hypothetical protein
VSGTFIYDGTYERFKEATAAHRAGMRLVCFRCRTPLLVALDAREAARGKIRPGVYCPKNQNHVALHLHLQKASDAERATAQDDS